MTRNSRSIKYLTGAAAIAAIAIGVAACGGGNGATAATAPATTANGDAATIGTASAGGLGTILVDSQGRTVYLFQKDTGTKSTCSGPCAAIWPPLRADGKATAGSGVNASMIGTTARSEGKSQVTYNGHPVYMYSGDQKPGDVNGQGLTDFGGSWYAVSPAGDQVVGQASSSGGGGAYSY